MSTKLPEWPTKPIDDRLSVWQPYWEQSVEAWSARCRLLYAALESYKGRESYKIFNDGINDSKTGLWADQALQDCGPLPEDTP